MGLAAAWQQDGMELSATCSCMHGLAGYSLIFTWRCNNNGSRVVIALLQLCSVGKDVAIMPFLTSHYLSEIDV
jgi:hypothetical protein